MISSIRCTSSTLAIFVFVLSALCVVWFANSGGNTAGAEIILVPPISEPTVASALLQTAAPPSLPLESGSNNNNNNEKSIVATSLQQNRLPLAHSSSSPRSIQYRPDVPACALRLYQQAQHAHDHHQQNKQSTYSYSVMSTNRNHHNSNNITATFMIHYSPLRKRRREMTRMLEQHGVSIDRWIVEFDRENITASQAGCFHPNTWSPAFDVLPNARPHHRRLRGGAASDSSDGYHPFASAIRKMKRHVLGKPIPSEKRLRPTQISVVTKHYFALYLAAQQPGLSLILEDDVLLRNGFRDHIQKILNEAKAFTSIANDTNSNNDNKKNIADGAAQEEGTTNPAQPSGGVGGGGAATTTSSSWNFDVLMIGGCLKMHAHRKRYAAPRWTEHLYLKPEARCAHAYIVTPRGAQKLINSMPLTLPIDFQLSSAFKEEGMTVLWVEPWLAVQGDIDGGCVTMGFYKSCPTMFLKPFPPPFNLSFIDKARDF